MTSNIATNKLPDKIKQSYLNIFNDTRDYFNWHQHEDSELKAEINVRLKHKCYSKNHISKISDWLNTGEKTRLEISQDLFAPFSTAWRIIKEIMHGWDHTNQNNITTNFVNALKIIHEN